MVFQEGSDVPFWMNPKQRVATKFSQYGEPYLKYKTKAGLLVNLKSYGVDIYVVKGGRLGQMRDIFYKIDLCNNDNKDLKGKSMDG